jgi:hypothetical protein
MNEVNDVEKNLPAEEPAGEEEQDNRSLQLAIEQIADDETLTMPHQKQLSDEVEQHQKKKRHARKVEKVQEQSQINAWFFTLMCMNIPIVGWIYLMYLAFSKKRTDRRNFARAYLFYKLLFLVIALIILAIIAVIASNLLDQLLAYMQML